MCCRAWQTPEMSDHCRQDCGGPWCSAQVAPPLDCPASCSWDPCALRMVQRLLPRVAHALPFLQTGERTGPRSVLSHLLSCSLPRVTLSPGSCVVEAVGSCQEQLCVLRPAPLLAAWAALSSLSRKMGGASGAAHWEMRASLGDGQLPTLRSSWSPSPRPELGLLEQEGSKRHSLPPGRRGTLQDP